MDVFMDTFNLYESLKPSILGLGISALNGVLGESFDRSNSPLAVQMGFYHQNRRLELCDEQLENLFPAPSSKIAIFVHGLASHEQLWAYPKDIETPTSRLSYGSLLLRDFDYTPLYLRFNSGLRISKNGRSLSALMEDLLKAYPVDVEQIVLVGHSLGGLLIRSACHYGNESSSEWTSKVAKIFYLGSPHLGTPWEDWAKGSFPNMSASEHPLAHKLGQVYKSRGAAIKDLRYPHLIDEDWQGDQTTAATSIPWLESVGHHFIGGTLTKDVAHPFSRVVGDGLVHLNSAHGHTNVDKEKPEPASIEKYSAAIPGINHLSLVHAPQVYTHIKRWMESAYTLSHVNTETQTLLES
jgi:pimeloyl-ACP methyl ester carboxylesterase